MMIMIMNCYQHDHHDHPDNGDDNDCDPALKTVGVKSLDDRLKAARLVNL